VCDLIINICTISAVLIINDCCVLVLPRTVGMLEHLLQSQSVDGRPLMSSSLRSPPAAPRPVTPVTPRSTSVSQSVSQASTSSVDLSHFEDKDWFEVRVLVIYCPLVRAEEC